MHGSYLHSDSYTLAYGNTQDRLIIDKTDFGFVVSRQNQRGVNIDRTEFFHYPDNNIWVTETGIVLYNATSVCSYCED